MRSSLPAWIHFWSSALTMRKNLCWCLFLLVAFPLSLGAAGAPTGLMCDLLVHPDKTVITTHAPYFGWIYNPRSGNDPQVGYRIIVASSRALAEAGKGDVWDSGMDSNSASINVPYEGPELKTDANYYWRVQTLDSSGQVSPFSDVQHLITGSSTNAWADRYPLHYVTAAPVLVTNTAPGRWFIDFGQDAFGYATLHLKGNFDGTNVQAIFGEMANGDSVNTSPPGKVRCGRSEFRLKDGDVTYDVRPPRDMATINPPPSCGNVMPFRYLELVNCPGTFSSGDLRQKRLISWFDTNASSFSSSSPALNQIWKLCRNSMEWLSFDGIYVDGDRERKPYEADSYIHQMSSYAVNNDYPMARHSFEYLAVHPTWPTEWKFHMIFIAWTDYLHTGNADLLRKYYSTLQHDSFTWAATPDGPSPRRSANDRRVIGGQSQEKDSPGGFGSGQAGGLMKGFPGYPQGANSDIVDWPWRDRDGFVGLSNHGYRNWTNAVNNAFYYRCLRIMARIADVIGRTNDATTYTADADRVYLAYNSAFWDANTKCYVDGVGTTHSSAHANFFPLAFGLVPADKQADVVNFLHSRIAAHGGMPCSVYGAQYLLEGLFQAGDSDTALDLLTTNGPRSWMNMINIGSTLTTEAWSFKDKPNEDWNHAWGAAPGNLIARYVLGLQPLSPGFGQILIQPHLGETLSYVQGTLPTIRGPVTIQATNTPEQFQLAVDIPGNVSATVMLPANGVDNQALVDGAIVNGTVSNNWLIITNIGFGRHTISVDSHSPSSQSARIKSPTRLHAGSK